MKPYVIYILGSGHSGSTILQYLLSGRPDVIGLGEVRQMADGRGWQNEVGNCSCGQPVQACPWWRGLDPHPPETTVEWYKRLINRKTELHPHATHVVDSSKTRHALRPWLTLASEGEIAELRVIYLVRDVRAWSVSDKNNRKRKQRYPRPVFLSMFDWWKNQIGILRFLKNQCSQIRPLIVSYESLIFQTEDQLARIEAFCDLKHENTNGEDRLLATTVHDVFGNRVKSDPDRRTKLTYDDRWQYRLSVNLSLPIMYPVWRLNSKLRKQAGA